MLNKYQFIFWTPFWQTLHLYSLISIFQICFLLVNFLKQINTVKCLFIFKYKEIKQKYIKDK